jgi:hypothetical protein
MFQRGISTESVRAVLENAQVCRNCGEAYVAEEISAKLLGMAEQSVRDGIEVGVRKYAPV